MNTLKNILELIFAIFLKQDSTDSAAKKSAPEPKEEKKPMGFILTHTKFCPDGIFGELKDENEKHICYTLEHSYDNRPKLANGEYTCVRGPHRLHGMTEDFTTFEIKGIPDFDGKPVTGVLFHWGNYNKDSEGCVLMGATETDTMVTGSRNTFAQFMQSLEGIDSFSLKVE